MEAVQATQEIPAIPETTASREAQVIVVTQAIPAMLVRQETPETTVQEGTVEVVALEAVAEEEAARLFLASTGLSER